MGFKKAGFSLLCGNDGEKDPGLVGPAAPPGKVWAPCILLRGQATAPTWGSALVKMDSRLRGNDGVGVRGSDGVGVRGDDESGIKKGTSEDVP